MDLLGLWKNEVSSIANRFPSLSVTDTRLGAHPRAKLCITSFVARRFAMPDQFAPWAEQPGRLYVALFSLDKANVGELATTTVHDGNEASPSFVTLLQRLPPTRAGIVPPVNGFLRFEITFCRTSTLPRAFAILFKAMTATRRLGTATRSYCEQSKEREEPSSQSR